MQKERKDTMIFVLLNKTSECPNMTTSTTNILFESFFPHVN